MTENRYGRCSQLSLQIGNAGGISFLRKSAFTAPFKVMNPFYTDTGLMRIMLVSVSAGIMAGDTQQIDIAVESGARVVVNSQSFEKIHKMDGSSASRKTVLLVADGASLAYLPLPVIPFAGSAFTGDVHIALAGPGSSLIYSDILTCGRIAFGERFAYRFYKNRTRITEGGALVYADNAAYLPAETDMAGLPLFGGYTHLSSLLLINLKITQEQTDYIRQ